MLSSILRKLANVACLSFILLGNSSLAGSDVDSPIVGAWAFGDASGSDSGVLVFLPNGIYFHAEDVTQDDLGDPDGVERGTYTWDESTGAFTATTIVDTNGSVGLSDTSDFESVTVSGDTLTISFTEAGSNDLLIARATSESNPLIGGWQYGNGQADDSGVVVFLANGYYFHAEDAEPNANEEDDSDGMEKGTYTWDQTTEVLSATALVDTNATSGLSGLQGELVFDVTEDELSFSAGSENVYLYRVAQGVTAGLPAVSEWRALKSVEYAQTADNFEPSPRAWTFYAVVATKNDNDATSVNISGGGIPGNYAFQQYGNSWELYLEYDTKAQLDAEFPNDGVFSITVSGDALGPLVQEFTFPAEEYPNIPVLTGTFYSEFQTLDSSADFDFSFSDPGSFTAENGRTVFQIHEDSYDDDDDEAFYDSVNGPQTSKTIPAGALRPASAYRGYLEYAIGHYIDGIGGFGVDGTASHNTGTDFTIRTKASQLVGAWTFGNPTTHGSGAIVFLNNGIYFQVEDTDNSDPDGIERGEYSWNQLTGEFEATAIVDTNETVGLSSLVGGESMSVTGDTLTLSDAAGSAQFPRVTSEANALIGAWQSGYGQSNQSEVVIFLDSGIYFHAGDTGENDTESDGMEKGTYTWDAETGAFSASISIDTNDMLGLSHPEGAITFTLSGDQLTFSDGVNEGVLTRVSPDTNIPIGLIPDSGLELAIRAALEKESGPITVADLQSLTSLSAQNSSIHDLSGLEHATGLQNLNLSFNHIWDLTPLSELTSLTWLSLSHNQVANLEPLSGLSQLHFLDVSDNHLEDPVVSTSSTSSADSEASGVLSPVANLTSLQTLRLANNFVQDLSSLATLVELKEVDVSGNRIEDLSPLAEITTLESVLIYNNPLDLSGGSDQRAIIDQIATNTGAEVVMEQPAQALSLSIREDITTGEFELVWNKASILQRSHDLAHWESIPAAQSPYPIPASEADLDLWRLYQPE